jgi:tetratricopeptide (TPR) repeat protein
VYFRAGRKLALPALAISVLLAGCSRNAADAPVDRIAVLRFENLGSDVSTDWMGRAFPEVIAEELAGARGIYAIGSGRLYALQGMLGVRAVAAPGISAERTLALAAGANRIGYGDYWIRNGKVEARLTVENPGTGRMTESLSASGAGVIETASALARAISSQASPYETRKADAVRAYAASLEAATPESAAQDLENAIAADPDYGIAYDHLAKLDAARGDRAGALLTIGRAFSRGNAIRGVARARIELDVAELRGDRAARRGALATLARLAPSDPDAWRSLGDAEMAGRAYPQAAEAYRKALAVTPEDTAALNQLGYAAAYSGDPAGAAAALRRYQALQPAEANPLDSLGDVSLIGGRLEEAGQFYVQAAGKDPSFLAGGEWLKAAMASLMTGDIAGADALHKRYLEAHAAAHDPAVDLRAAEWHWVSGRRQEACREIEGLARGAAQGPMREIAARALAELAIWRASLGDRDGAGRALRQAQALSGPSPAPLTRAAAILLQPPADLPADPPDSTATLAAACGLLLDRRFQPAAALLARLYAGAAPGNDEGIPILLAWAYLETGRAADAAPLLRFNPIPPAAGLSPLTAFYFPQIFRLRAIEAEKQGKSSGAARNLDLFRRLSGPDPLVWER